jgi:hypothetical protein
MTRASDTAKLLGAGATILDGTTISTADNTAQLTLASTDADSNFGPLLTMYRNSSSPADADFLGDIEFQGENSAGETITYAQVFGRTGDVTDGTEDGRIATKIMIAGASLNVLDIKSDEIVINDDSADLDFRVESNGQANMFVVDAGNDTVSFTPNSGNLAVKAGRVDSTNNVRLEAGGTTSTYLEYRGYLGHIFDVNTTEKMRINSSGYIYVNTGGAEPHGSQVGTRITGTQGQAFWKSANSGTTGYGHLIFYNANGEVGQIYTASSGVVYATSSDYRLKENVVTEWDATTRLKQLKPSRFNFIADADTTVDGFLAHEVSSIVPEAITGTKDAMTAEVLYVEGDELPDGKVVGDVKTASEPDYQGIDQSKLVPLLVKTIQELEARITALES